MTKSHSRRCLNNGAEITAQRGATCVDPSTTQGGRLCCVLPSCAAFSKNKAQRKLLLVAGLSFVVLCVLIFVYQ